MKEENKQFEKAFELFKKENPKWNEYLTDSTYHELMEWYANKFNFEWDEENGYPNEVSEFTHYIWKQLCPQAYDTKEYVKVEKELLKDLLQLLKDSNNEGNCFASLIIKKHSINEREL